MTRDLLRQFVKAHGIVTAAIKLGGHPITLERALVGQQNLPKAMGEKLEQLQAISQP